MIQVVNGPKNLLAWNEELNRNPPWVPTRLTVPSINNTSPQFGNNSAAILHEDATLANTHIFAQSISLNYGAIYTSSMCVKAINRSWFAMAILGAAPYCYFNVTTGVVGSTADVLSTSISPIGAGWYLCAMTYRRTTSGAASFFVYMASANGVAVFDGLNQDSLYLWRPQLNYGYYPDDTFKTAEVPVS